MKGSKLKVLRAVVALERFTVADVVGWAGLESSQVIPQLARLQDEAVIEHDTNHPEKTDKPRPAHRPVRHYRVSTKSPAARKHSTKFECFVRQLGKTRFHKGYP